VRQIEGAQLESAESIFQEISKAGQLLNNTWLLRQSNDLDNKTRHIYKCRLLSELNEHASRLHLTSEESGYALHRWRNFKRHEAWQSLLFEQVPAIKLAENPFSKTQDFFIHSDGIEIPFDLKVTRFPKSLTTEVSDQSLAEWFYKNQSTQGRFHLANRFFVVGQPENALYDLELARKTIRDFSKDMRSYRHFINHGDGQMSRTVVLRQRAAG
jgi:hypothetical protein